MVNHFCLEFLDTMFNFIKTKNKFPYVLYLPKFKQFGESKQRAFFTAHTTMSIHVFLYLNKQIFAVTESKVDIYFKRFPKEYIFSCMNIKSMHIHLHAHKVSVQCEHISGNPPTWFSWHSSRVQYWVPSSCRPEADLRSHYQGDCPEKTGSPDSLVPQYQRRGPPSTPPSYRLGHWWDTCIPVKVINNKYSLKSFKKHIN